MGSAIRNRILSGAKSDCRMVFALLMWHINGIFLLDQKYFEQNLINYVCFGPEFMFDSGMIHLI